MIVERRAKIRFPVEGKVVFRAHKRWGPTISGTGESINFSSRGLLFATSEPLEVGMRIDLAMNWGAALGAACRLKLVVSGRIVRVKDGRAAVKIDHYEHRTRKNGQLSL